MSEKILEKGATIMPAKKERTKIRKRIESAEFWYDPMSYPSFSRKS